MLTSSTTSATSQKVKVTKLSSAKCAKANSLTTSPSQLILKLRSVKVGLPLRLHQFKMRQFNQTTTQSKPKLLQFKMSIQLNLDHPLPHKMTTQKKNEFHHLLRVPTKMPMQSNPNFRLQFIMSKPEFLLRKRSFIAGEVRIPFRCRRRPSRRSTDDDRVKNESKSRGQFLLKSKILNFL